MSLCVVISVDSCNASVLCLLGMSRGDYVNSIPELCIVMMACGIIDRTFDSPTGICGQVQPNEDKIVFWRKGYLLFPCLFYVVTCVVRYKFGIVC